MQFLPTVRSLCLIPGFVGWLLPLSLQAGLTVAKPRCEYLVNPMGVDEVHPRFSWIVESTRRGEKQTSWQILVSSTEEGLASDQGNLWDSGKTAGSETYQIAYAGSPLGSRMTCYWKVRSWDKDGVASPWSAPAKWTMGLLAKSDWSAQWIDGKIAGPSGDTATAPTILEAKYEGVTAGSGSKDVTAQLASMATQGNYSLGVTNLTFGGDPAYNTVKQLRVRYQRGQNVGTKTFAEDTQIVFPGDLPLFGSPVIQSARYESATGTGFRDVTSILTTKAALGSFSMVVNNTNFGPDPAANQVKRLRINYTLDGVAGLSLVAENQSFNFPLDLPKPVNAQITAARYESLDGSGSLDVMAKLTTLGAAGSYSLVVNNTTFGSDPAANKTKRLAITYQLNGRTEVKTIGEKATFAFPVDLAAPDNVPYLRKSFAVAKEVKKATLYATALGLYELQLNGSRVGDHILAPEWTDYTKRLRYQSYDVTSQLAAGTNVFGAQLANGWYSGHIGNGNYQHWGISPALLAQLEIEYTDGSSERVVTDGSWKMGSSPMVSTDFMEGESYDARREIADWSRPGFDDSSWASTLIRLESDRIMSGQVMEPVRDLMEIAPKTLTEPKTGKWTYDLGQNMVGVLKLKITAAAGTRIVLRHAEMLNPDGTVYTDNLRGAPSVDTYVCKGGGEEIWKPKFTFHGFRYVELTGITTRPPLDAVTGIVFATDNERAGRFTSSDGFVNQLQSNIEWGQRGNYLSVPTDCPQRDERLGWLGDAQVFVNTATYNSDIAAFFSKWMVDVTDSQYADGRLPDVAPDSAPSSGTPAWNDAVVICPWTIYQAYGDKRILEKCYPAMKAWVEYCRTNSTNSIRDRGRGADYGDWLSINADTNKELIGTAYYAYSTRLLAKSAAVIGNTTDAASYEALFQTIKTAFNKKYVNPTTGAFIGTGSSTQCSYAMALKFELLPDSLRAPVSQLLENDVVAKGNHLSTGFVGVSYLLPTLTDGGKTDTAYRLLVQDTFPSWMFSVKLGATTIWERWDGWTPTNGFQATIMNSFNHYSLGSCGEWLYGTVAGIKADPSVPAFKKIIIHPKPGNILNSASGSLMTMNGQVSSSWRKFEGGFILETTIPANTTAEIHVPATQAAEVMESGNPTTASLGLTFLRMEDGTAVFSADSGRYRFTTGNAAAEPGSDTVSHDDGASFEMKISTLLANDGAAAGFVSADTFSSKGAAISVAGGAIRYVPGAGATGADTFTYWVRDAAGGISSRTVNVNVIPSDAPVQRAESMEKLPDGGSLVKFSGVPGRIYRIESSETLVGPAAWTTRGSVQADENGRFQWTDPQPLPGARFYRAVFP